MGDITTIGLDLAKSVFQVHAVDEVGGIVLRKRLRRSQVLAFFAGISPCLVGLEAHALSAWKPMPCRPGSLRDSALLGPRVDCAWP